MGMTSHSTTVMMVETGLRGKADKPMLHMLL